MKFTFTIAIWALLFVLPLGAQEKTEATASVTVVVVASGVGVDADKSLRNALRNAVEQAVGLIVDAETVVKNEDVIKDQILTYSDGFVEKFDRVKEGKRDDGLYETKIKAVVKRRQLIEKLKEAKISTAKIEGESLFAEVVTQLGAEKNAAKLLEKALDGLPVNLLTATVADPKPEIVQKNDSGVKAKWTVVVGFDYKAYESNVLPKLLQILNTTAKRKGNTEDAYTAGSRGFAYAREPTVTQSKKLSLWQDDGYLPIIPNPFDHQTELFLIVNTGRNSAGNLRRWRWYVLDKDTSVPVFKRIASRTYFAKMSFLGNDNQIVRESSISLDKESPVSGPNGMGSRAEPRFPWFILRSDRKGFPSVEIAPYVRANVAPDIGLEYGDALEYAFEEEFSLEEIKKIREIRCSVVEKKTRNQDNEHE